MSFHASAQEESACGALPRPCVTFEVRFEVGQCWTHNRAGLRGLPAQVMEGSILVGPIYSFRGMLVKQNLRLIVLFLDDSG